MRVNRKSGAGSGPFLMEMLAVVGFFILCSAICVLVFVKADRISREARDINQAVLMAESLAEEMKIGWVKLHEMLPDRDIWEHLVRADSLNSQQAHWLEELEKSEGYGGMYTFYWDSRWQPMEPASAPFYLGVIRTGTVERMRRSDILIMSYGDGKDKGKVLYRLQTETYEAP